MLRRFLPPYKGYLALNILFNLLSTVLSLFSFAAIIPVLQILFGLDDGAAGYMPVEWSSGMEAVVAALKNNLYFWIGAEVSAGRAGYVLFALGLFLVLMTGLKCGCAFLASFFMVPIRTGVLRDLRQQLYEKVVALPIGFFTEERKGDIMSRMTSDVGEVEASIIASLDMLFKDPIMIIIYLVTLFVLSWQLTLFVLILLPTAGWLIGRIGRSLKRQSKRGQELNADILTQIEETLGGLRVVKAFVAEDKLVERFARLNNETRRTFNRLHRRYMLAHPVSEFLGTALIAVLLWYGGGLILADNATIDAAVFIYYLVIFYSIINPAKDLSKAAYSIRKGKASLERIDRILNADTGVENTADDNTASIHAVSQRSYSGSRLYEAPGDHASDDVLLSFSHVSFAYKEGVPVLKDICFDVKKGETVAFVGQSGSGKTTLLDLVPRFYDPQEGAVMLRGTDVRRIHTGELRAQIGYVNQDAILFNDTVFNNIVFGLPAEEINRSDANLTERVRRAAEIANALEFIEAMPDGFDTIVGDRGSRLSGGQRQRISIARAVITEPEILILDEATSALDTESEQLVQQALDNLLSTDYCTKLVVAHRLSTVRNANRIYVLHEGEIVETGTHDQLLEKGGYYAKLLKMQQAK